MRYAWMYCIILMALFLAVTVLMKPATGSEGVWFEIETSRASVYDSEKFDVYVRVHNELGREIWVGSEGVYIVLQGRTYCSEIGFSVLDKGVETYTFKDVVAKNPSENPINVTIKGYVKFEWVVRRGWPGDIYAYGECESKETSVTVLPPKRFSIQNILLGVVGSSLASFIIGALPIYKMKRKRVLVVFLLVVGYAAMFFVLLDQYYFYHQVWIWLSAMLILPPLLAIPLGYYLRKRREEVKFRQCGKCGATMPKNAKFCGKCGTKL